MAGRTTGVVRTLAGSRCQGIFRTGGFAMPVTAGHVPGLTSGLRRVRTDPRRFHTVRWFFLAEGVLVCSFGIAGLVSAILHPHAGPTGAPVFGLASAPAHSSMLLAFGVVARAAVGNRR